MKSMAPNWMRKRILDISRVTITTETIFYALLLLTGSSSLLASAQVNPVQSRLTPMNCSAPSQPPCASYLYFIANKSHTRSEIAYNFNVDITDILVGPGPHNSSFDSYTIPKACSCNGNTSATGAGLLANVSYTPTPADVNLTVSDISLEHYDGLVYLPAIPSNPVIKPNVPLNFQLLCGCPTAGWSTIITYIAQQGDDANPLSVTFNSTPSAITSVNQLDNVNVIKPGQCLFIPTNSTTSKVAGGTVQSEQNSPSPGEKSNGLIAGVISGLAVLLVLVLVTACGFWVRRMRNHGVYARSFVEHSGQVSSTGPLSGPFKEQSRQSSFITNLFKFHKARGGLNNNVKRTMNLPREAMDFFDQEKPIVFNYEEIIEATDNFNESKKVGQGAYGGVYSGILRQQNVAIKQMKTTKSREFYAELKVLCKVHHTNLVELLGYSAGDESLFLVYEFAENGALSEHLHGTGSPEANNKVISSVGPENPPLSWTARVQIALDTARGLEYIHDHTKAHYVHRDVKSSNILLDGFFRAKVADFGLAKLVEQHSEQFISTSRIVGTFGYMAPEYIHGGHTTTKSDVYSFGVVLYELVTGQQAMSRVGPGRRSIVSFMFDILKEEHDPKLRFEGVVDPRLGDCIPLEWSFKTAKLARACVEEDPANRPDMRTVVFSLSQFLLNSIEWEAAFGGRSQIFSGLTQGR